MYDFLVKSPFPLYHYNNYNLKCRFVFLTLGAGIRYRTYKGTGDKVHTGEKCFMLVRT